jgi:hypothetical protein
VFVPPEEFIYLEHHLHLCLLAWAIRYGCLIRLFNSSEPSMLKTLFLPSLWPIGSHFVLLVNGLGSFFKGWVLDLHIWQQLAI